MVDQSQIKHSIPKRAVILAGGLGTRLRPYTKVLPKPLMPIGPYPILEVVIRQLAQAGFEHITLAVNHQAKIIQAFFNSGENLGVYIDYSFEAKPLGTMGPLKIIADLPINFLVMNGDVLTDLNFKHFYDFHAKDNNLFTIASCKRDLPSEFGVLDIGEKDSTLKGFREKPIIQYNVSMGIYMVSRMILEFIPEGLPYGFDHLMKDMLAIGRNIHVYKHSGYWLDIGRPSDYEQAIEMFETNCSLFLP